MRFLTLALFFLLLSCRQATPPETATPKPTVTATPAIGVEFVTLPRPTAAIVQLTPSPLPTPTATPTPTPIVYTVVEGDTLWSIAYLNGSEPNAVGTLNPNVRPETLQIGQQLLLPPPATPLLQNARGTPVPVNVAVTVVDLYQTPVGSAWVMGAVENRGEFAAENLQIEIVLHAADSEQLASVIAWVIAPILLPGQSAPFGVLVRELADEPVNVTTAVIAGDSVSDFGSRYLDLTVAEAELTTEEGRVLLQAEITNVGAQQAQQVRLVAAFYDDNGSISGFAVGRLQQPLAAGETQTLQLAAAPPGGAVADITLAAYALTAVD